MNTDIDGFQRGCKLEGLHPLLIVTYKNITISVSFSILKILENRFYLPKRSISSFQQIFYFNPSLLSRSYLFILYIFFFKMIGFNKNDRVNDLSLGRQDYCTAWGTRYSEV